MLTHSYIIFMIPFYFHFIASANRGSTVPHTLVNVGVLSGSQKGTLLETCMSVSLSDFYSVHSDYQTRLVLRDRPCEDLLSTVSSVLDLLKYEEVHAILMPEKCPIEEKFVTKMGDKVNVPTISLSEPSLSHAKAITEVIRGFGWHEIVLINEDSGIGNEFLSHISDAFESSKIHLAYEASFHTSINDLRLLEELSKILKSQKRVFLAHVTTKSLGLRLFELAQRVGLMSKGYAWVITNEFSSSLDSLISIPDSMEGVLGVKHYIPKSKHFERFTERLNKELLSKRHISLNSKLDISCLLAYDLVGSLAMAVEKIRKITLPPSLFRVNDSKNYDKTHENSGVSSIGRRLIDEILAAEYKGLTGKFSLLDGKVMPSGFEIFNVVGNVKRVIGYLTTNEGMSKTIVSYKEMNKDLTLEKELPGRKLSSAIVPKQTFSVKEFKTVIWPGDSAVTPKSSAPAAGKKTLTIGIPGKRGFPEFVKIIHQPKKVNATGFSIDVFRAAVNLLPPEHRFNMEFEPFNGSYDDLVCQITKKKFDAVVGDVTILFHRRACCDFTLPYAESGVGMLVPLKQGGQGDMWVFIKPLRWDLWLTIFLTCIFIGVAVKVLEHRVNTDFQGPPRQQLSTMFFFPFAWLVCPHSEMVLNVCSKFVLFMWLALAHILMQSYTASLSARLTVEQLQPRFPSIHELRSGDCKVGYQGRTFVGDALIKMGFKRENLIPYSSVEEFHRALSQKNVSAIFDEISYLKVFLKKYSNGFLIARPISRTTGFGFAFPKGSKLTSFISDAILNLTEHGEIDAIERKYMGEGITKPQIEQPQIELASDTSPSLGADSFGGLFVLIGAATMVALLISKRRIWQRLFSRATYSSKKWFASFKQSHDTNGTRKQQVDQNNDFPREDL